MTVARDPLLAQLPLLDVESYLMKKHECDHEEALKMAANKRSKVCLEQAFSVVAGSRHSRLYRA